MTSSAPRLRVGRILAFGVVAEVAVILLIIVTLTLHSRVFAAGQPQEVLDAFAERAPAVIGPVAGILFTFIAALYCTRPLEVRHRTHGVLVGVVTTLLTLPDMIMATTAMRPLYLAAMMLKLIAGLAGGAYSERRQVMSVRSSMPR
jgi:hypothetical protein